MVAHEAAVSRRDHILQALADMLASHPGGRMTTAALAKQVGVTEAALYRHFPSKARMFEGLIDFTSDALLSIVARAGSDYADGRQRLQYVLFQWLAFTERNPGLARVLTGDALTGEHKRLQAQVVALFNTLNAQLCQLLEAVPLPLSLPAPLAAGLLLAVIEGLISQFVRSGFQQSPTQVWDQQWCYLAGGLFGQEPGRAPLRDGGRQGEGGSLAGNVVLADWSSSSR